MVAIDMKAKTTEGLGIFSNQTPGFVHTILFKVWDVVEQRIVGQVFDPVYQEIREPGTAMVRS